MATAKEKREARARAIAETNHEAIIRPDAVESASGEIAKPASSGGKVTVACKLGIATIDIQLCKMEEKFQQNMQGGRMVTEASRIGPVVRLRGTSYPRGTPPAGFPAPPEIVDGAALNHGIDKDFWDEWVKQNHLNPYVMNRMIFAHESRDHVVGLARELKDQKSGLDPLDPKSKDPRLPRSTREEISDPETGQRKSA